MALLYRSYECIQLGLALEIAEKPRRAFPRGEAPQAYAVPGPTAGHLSLGDHRRVALGSGFTTRFGEARLSSATSGRRAGSRSTGASVSTLTSAVAVSA